VKEKQERDRFYQAEIRRLIREIQEMQERTRENQERTERSRKRTQENLRRINEMLDQQRLQQLDKPKARDINQYRGLFRRSFLWFAAFDFAMRQAAVLIGMSDFVDVRRGV